MGPNTPITSAADVERLWTQMMGPGGFGRRTLWLVFLDSRSCTSGVVMPIDDIPALPGPGIDNLAQVLDSLDDVDVGAVLALFSRPGTRAIQPGDRAWARALRAALGPRLGPWPIHLATRDHIQVFAADDLIGTG